jgi:hypothetical protein
MSDVEFVQVRHPDIEVPATVAVSALPYLAGWVPVDEAAAAPAKRTAPTKRTRTRPVRTPAAAPVAAVADVVVPDPPVENADPA